MVDLKRKTWIDVYNETDRDVLKQVQEYIAPYAIETKLKGGPLTIILYAETPEFDMLITELMRQNLEYRRAEVREYSKKELEQAELFYMEIVYPWELDGGTPDFGTKYAKSCPNCNHGLIQKSDLIVNIDKLKKYDISTTQPEIVINERLRLLLEVNQITGYILRPVIDYKGRTEPIMYQLIINNTLPAMSNEIRFDIVKNDPHCSPCKTCGRNGIIRRSEAIYEREKLKNVCDFNLSTEFFGINLYCRQDIIVSAELRKLFQTHKIKRVAFDPVGIIGTSGRERPS